MGARQVREDRTSVAVIGAGPGGCAAAIRLARAGCAVSLVEGDDRAEWKVGECLPPCAKPLLQRLGVWESFCRERHRPCYGNRSAWGATGLAEHDFIFDPCGCGWHLDRVLFDDTLRRAARESGALCWPGARLVSSEPDPQGGWRLTLASDSARCVLRAEFVVEATGRASPFARARGARRLTYDRLVGAARVLTAGVRETEDQDARTLVEATEEGWWYSAPIPDGLLVVFMTDADLWAAGPARKATGWAELVAATTHTGRRVRALHARPAAPPRVVPATSSRLDVPAGEGWVAVGDAAATYDPLSSRGIATALAEGLRTGDAVAAWMRGEVSVVADGPARARQGYDDYLREYAAQYARERRWASAPFWRRRAARPRPIGRGRPEAETKT
jgi:2-polyprenyl-6-methoxyphenol hydroxylase-like FAD-dependent oxidoreductase